MQYQNRKNGTIGKLIEQNDKTKTVILEMEDGRTTSITTSTLKRWWKKIEDSDDQYITEVMSQKKELGIKCPKIESVEIVEENLVPIPGGEKLEELKEEYAGDGTPLSQVGKEIAEQAKEKAKKVKASKTSKKKDRTALMTKIRDFLASESSVTKIRERGTYFIAIKVNNKALLEVRLTSTSDGGSLYTKEEAADRAGYKYSKINNYYLPAVIKLSEDTEIFQAVKSIIKGGN